MHGIVWSSKTFETVLGMHVQIAISVKLAWEAALLFLKLFFVVSKNEQERFETHMYEEFWYGNGPLAEGGFGEKEE